MRPLMGFHQAGIDVYYGPEGETVGAVIDHLIRGEAESDRGKPSLRWGPDSEGPQREGAHENRYYSYRETD